MAINQLHFVSFRDRPIIYGRVPKVANSSVKAALSKLLKEKPVENGRVQSDNYWRKLTNGETDMISPEEAWKLRKEKYVFAFVRNPLDRLVSCYHNKILNEDSFTPQMKETGYKFMMSFPDFVQRTFDVPNEDLDVHIMPQSEMLLYDGMLIPQFIGHFEDMENQWIRLKRRLSNRFEIEVQKLPKKNVRREGHEDVAQYFNDDKLVELAMKKYDKDIAVFYPGVTAEQLVSGDFTVPEVARPLSKRGRKAQQALAEKNLASAES